MHEQRPVCRVLTDGELERSVSQHANLGSASFSKGKPTSRYTFIPKSDSPGPIYDIRTPLGEDCSSPPSFPPLLCGMTHTQMTCTNSKHVVFAAFMPLQFGCQDSFCIHIVESPGSLKFVSGPLCTFLAGFWCLFYLVFAEFFSSLLSFTVNSPPFLSGVCEAVSHACARSQIGQ